MNTLKKPEWIKKKLFYNEKENSIKSILNDYKVNTVCNEAHCPNRGECFSNKTATFLLLGKFCTRNCRFCNIDELSKPEKLDLTEPLRVAKAINKMNLKYVVLTSVTRDDLPDGGAGVFIETIYQIKKINKDILIEILVPDFNCDENILKEILSTEIVVFNHNLETVKYLYKFVRPHAIYERSLKVLELAKRNNKSGKILIKTGLMAGLGETKDQMLETIADFNDIGGDILTIGQYLSPSKNHYPVKEYITPKMFEMYKNEAEKIGIKKTVSGPFVRSSYFAEKYYF